MSWLCTGRIIGVQAHICNVKQCFFLYFSIVSFPHHTSESDTFSPERLFSLRVRVIVFRTCRLGFSLDLSSPSCVSSFLLSSLPAGALLTLLCSICRCWFLLVNLNGYKSSFPTLMFVHIRIRKKRGQGSTVA